MREKMRITRTLIVMVLSMVLTAVPVLASDGMAVSYSSVSPRFGVISGAYITIGFRMDNMVYCSVDVDPYSNCSGISGMMKLFDSAGTCLAAWPVSDYEGLIFAEFSYQGVYGETYTATFEGYAYSNDGTAPDRLELSVTDTCK